MSDGDDCPPELPRPRWLDWCERNAIPKRYKFPRRKRRLTRWQKRGPMQRRDWVRFYKWAAKNALPKDMQKKKKPPKPYDPREERRKRLNKKPPLEDRLKRTPDLAEARWPREKHVYPDPPPPPYIPQIDVKKPAPVPEKGRPRTLASVPKQFQHIELEMEFWTTLRFAIHPSTRTYRPSKNIKRLAVPRVTPPLVPHCPIPVPPPEIIPPRRKFTPRQWKQHKARLEGYLAQPRVLHLNDELYF